MASAPERASEQPRTPQEFPTALLSDSPKDRMGVALPYFQQLVERVTFPFALTQKLNYRSTQEPLTTRTARLILKGMGKETPEGNRIFRASDLEEVEAGERRSDDGRLARVDTFKGFAVLTAEPLKQLDALYGYGRRGIIAQGADADIKAMVGEAKYMMRLIMMDPQHFDSSDKEFMNATHHDRDDLVPDRLLGIVDRLKGKTTYKADRIASDTISIHMDTKGVPHKEERWRLLNDPNDIGFALVGRMVNVSGSKT